ncbi:phage holin family protein [Demequina sp. NBRC 110053]|uniref:phage holin family protein n=1 Tax=Demequina sp. NBRC 110053 TaxID=1570342 RepID=UPI000A076319|nr:phage holin family protein [Demequina sp. NBRC 110053]
MKFVLNVIVISVAVWIATLLPLDLVVTGGEAEWWTRVLAFLALGAVIALLNAIVKPVLSVLALPITILTLGLFALVINWFILWLTAWISEQVDFVNLSIGGFWQTLLAALVISIASALMGTLVGSRRD